MTFPFRQTAIAASLAVIKIPIKQAQRIQETKKPMNECRDIHEAEKTHQSAGNWLSGLLDFDADEAPDALPVFGSDYKAEQLALVRVIGARLEEARELCNLSQLVAAKRLGYSNSSKLSKVEGATDTNSVPLWLILRAARMYGVSIDFLFGVTDDWEAGAGLGEQAFLLEAWEQARRRDLAALLEVRRRVVEVARLVPAIAQAAEQVIEALARFREINPGFDEMRAGARLVAVAETLQQHSREAARTVSRFRADLGVDRRDGRQ